MSLEVPVSIVKVCLKQLKKETGAEEGTLGRVVTLRQRLHLNKTEFLPVTGSPRVSASHKRKRRSCRWIPSSEPGLLGCLNPPCFPWFLHPHTSATQSCTFHLAEPVCDTPIPFLYNLHFVHRNRPYHARSPHPHKLPTFIPGAATRP